MWNKDTHTHTHTYIYIMVESEQLNIVEWEDGTEIKNKIEWYKERGNERRRGGGRERGEVEKDMSNLYPSIIFEAHLLSQWTKNFDCN